MLLLTHRQMRLERSFRSSVARGGLCRLGSGRTSADLANGCAAHQRVNVALTVPCCGESMTLRGRYCRSASSAGSATGSTSRDTSGPPGPPIQLRALCSSSSASISTGRFQGSVASCLQRLPRSGRPGLRGALATDFGRRHAVRSEEGGDYGISGSSVGSTSHHPPTTWSLDFLSRGGMRWSPPFVTDCS